MLNTILKYKFPIFLVCVLYLTHLYTKDFSSPYQKPIVGDSKAYYAYLPAILIYQDSQYGFIDDYEKKYYATNQRKDFLNTTENGKMVNKTFPGAAILYLPFFLIAHVLSLFFGVAADGYSIIYQYLFDFGYWVYLLIGAIFYLKVFRLLQFKDKYIYFSLFILLVGTNILFYTIIDQSVTHIFNFAMINGFIYQLLKYKTELRNKYLYYAIAILLLIGITRPTNILALLLIPIFISEKIFYFNLLKDILKPKNIFIITVIILIIGCIPFFLWQWQTGNWIVYSYGEESFDFTNPQIYNFLFSYMKGWFTYTPIALLILILGLYYTAKQSKFKMFLIISFYSLSVYIFSSWWCWYYGAGMGQRVMIDHYILLGFLMLIILQKAPLFVQRVLIVSLGLLLILNVVQAAQIKKGIYKMGSPNKEMYWNNFLSLRKKAIVYEKSEWLLIEQKHVLFNPKYGFIKKGNPKQEGESYFIQTNDQETYSPSLIINMHKRTSKIVVSWNALAQAEILESRLVITTIEKKPQSKVIYLKEFMVLNSNTEMEFLIEFDFPINSIELYFWNGNTNEKVDYSELKIISYE
jgi:hypothetical protein